MTRTENRSFRRWTIAGATVALLGLVVANAFALGPRHEHGMGGEFHEFMLNKMLDSANATDEQREQILAIVTTAHEDVAAMRDGTRGELQEQMLAILTAETVDRAAIDALRAEHEQRLAAAMDRMIDAIVDSAALLSQEQRVAIAEEMRERFEQHGERGFHGRGWQ